MAVSSWRDRFGWRPDAVTLSRALFVPLISFVLSATILVILSPFQGPLHSPEAMPGSLPLTITGATPIIVAASIGMGMFRLYFTAVPLALLLVSALGGLIGGQRLLAVSVLCGVLAAGTLTVLSGCSCGTGSTTSLWHSVAWAFANGLTPFGFTVGVL